ncbi:MAG: Magnesium transporter MgtE [Phycisphaerae bacterium]|nr:Magnesium transporter MgtE [Phycisphaerae bacterium]
MSMEVAERLTADSMLALWPALSDDERVDGFRLLSPEDARDLFDGLSSPDQADLIRQLSHPEALIWMRVLPPDDAADLLQVIAPEERERFEALLDASTLREAKALLAYAEDEAGGLMNPRFARVRPDVSVDVAIRYLRRQTQQNLATFYYAYVLDQEQRVLGVVSFRELFGAPGDKRVDEIMRTNVVSVVEHTDQESVARTIAAHDLTALPVVDAEGRMRGVITVDDIVDVVQEEATEDIHKLGAVETLGAPYLDVGFLSMIRKRGVWLSVLFVGELLTATAMGYFEHEIARAVVLAMFVPLIISSGGNSGSQAATLIVRSLALRELRLADWWRVCGREIRAGATLGAWLGLLGFVRVLLWQQLGLYDYGPHSILIGATVMLSLLGVVVCGTVAGSMLPFVLRRLGLDPATSSAPFVATLVDVTGLVIYFAVAAAVLHNTLL